MSDTATTSPCIIYAGGLVHCSVCAPLRYTVEMVEAEVNAINPTGISSPWKVSTEPFASGESNPCPCSDLDRQHWLMVC